MGGDTLIRAMFPGSFDPFTLGHLDLMQRALTFVDELVVAVMVNPEKSGFLPEKLRKEMLAKAVDEHIANPGRVKIISWSGLLVECALAYNLRLVIRGVRGTIDLENERAMAFANSHLLPGLETVFLPASQGKGEISSTLVRQIAALKGNYSHFVPPSVAETLRLYMNRIRPNT